MATLSSTQTKEECTSSYKTRQQLLPGIPDEITLREICPKLPWKVFYDCLSSGSRAWRHAIRSREVYDARVLSHSTETLLIVNLSFPEGRIALWSMMGDSSLIELPLISNRIDHLVSLDGRIYLFEKEASAIDFEEAPAIDIPYPLGSRDDSSQGKDVFVLDVAAGERQWRKCTSRRERRTLYGCSVIHGKIYLFGGHKFERGVFKRSESEVYDPERDFWSLLKPMPGTYLFHQTEAVGEEFFFPLDPRVRHKHFPISLNIYHPGKDEWRVAGPFKTPGNKRPSRFFVAHGKLHSAQLLSSARGFGISSILVYNVEENSWTKLHSSSYIDRHDGPRRIDVPTIVTLVDGELLMKYSEYTIQPEEDFPHMRHCLVKSKGFNSQNKDILWQMMPWTYLLNNNTTLTTILL